MHQARPETDVVPETRFSVAASSLFFGQFLNFFFRFTNCNTQRIVHTQAGSMRARTVPLVYLLTVLMLSLSTAWSWIGTRPCHHRLHPAAGTLLLPRTLECWVQILRILFFFFILQDVATLDGTGVRIGLQNGWGFSWPDLPICIRYPVNAASAGAPYPSSSVDIVAAVVAGSMHAAAGRLDTSYICIDEPRWC